MALLTFVIGRALSSANSESNEALKSNLEAECFIRYVRARSLHVISIKQLKIMFLLINRILCVNRFDWISITICMSENDAESSRFDAMANKHENGKTFMHFMRARLEQ